MAALTLRNTVQPSSMSMGSSSSDSDLLLKKLAPAAQKEGKKNMFKRAFGVGKKRTGSPAPSLGTLAEPGAEENTDEEKEQEQGWNFVEREKVDMLVGDGRGPGAAVRRRPATSDRMQPVQQHPVRQQVSLRLPGEDDSDEEVDEIEYAPSPIGFVYSLRAQVRRSKLTSTSTDTLASNRTAPSSPTALALHRPRAISLPSILPRDLPLPSLAPSTRLNRRQGTTTTLLLSNRCHYTRLTPPPTLPPTPPHLHITRPPRILLPLPPSRLKCHLVDLA